MSEKELTEKLKEYDIELNNKFIENRKLKLKIEQLQEDLDAEKSTSSNLARIIVKAIEYIGNGNLGIPRKTREKFIKILKGE